MVISFSSLGTLVLVPDKYELALALSENDLALTSPCPTKLVNPVREENESDFTVRQ